MRVVIVDDDAAFALVVKALLASERRIAVVGDARNGAEAVDEVVSTRPDVVLMDLEMPVLDGVEATRRICDRHLGACVIMLSGSENHERLAAAQDAGASAFVRKEDAASELVDVVLRAAAGARAE